MKTALKAAKSPHDASLESVVPGIQSFHRAHQQELSGIQLDMEGLKASVTEGFSEVQQQHKRDSEAQDRRLVACFWMLLLNC